jgi:hypothetical protein
MHLFGFRVSACGHLLMSRDNYAQRRTAWPHKRAILLDGVAGRPAVEYHGWSNGPKTVDAETLSGNCWPELELALTAQYTAHHGRIIQGALERIDLLERPITARDGYMGAWVAPLQPQIAQLGTIPGLHETAARAI